MSTMKPSNTFINRRRFLRNSATAIGAAVFAPMMIPCSVLGMGGTTAPSERIRMGFIGLGGQGTGHLLGDGFKGLFSCINASGPRMSLNREKANFPLILSEMKEAKI
jgi:hypothetical protein